MIIRDKVIPAGTYVLDVSADWNSQADFEPAHKNTIVQVVCDEVVNLEVVDPEQALINIYEAPWRQSTKDFIIDIWKQVTDQDIDGRIDYETMVAWFMVKYEDIGTDEKRCKQIWEKCATLDGQEDISFYEFFAYLKAYLYGG